MKRWRWLAAALCCAAEPSAQTRLYTFDGASQVDAYGYAVSHVGDADGDGYADFLIGAPFEDQGTARLYSGRHGTLLHTFVGESFDDHFGLAVAGPGDVDGDGRGDVLVGAPWDGKAGPHSGSVYLFSGASSQLIKLTIASGSLEEYGSSLGGAGDVNADGVLDYIVGAPKPFFGAARVVSGADGSILYGYIGSSAIPALGSAVDGIGDVDSDGYGDFAVGTRFANLQGSLSGVVLTHSGADGSVLHTFTGDYAYQGVGRALAGVGDQNGDGVPDVAAGALNMARVYSGADGAILHSFHAEPEPCGPSSCYVQFGWAVDGLPDADGDGCAELLVGSFPNDVVLDLPGYASVHSGKSGALLLVVPGDELDQGFGGTVAGLGDVNGDGKPDFAVGAPLTGVHTGRAQVHSSVPLPLASDVHLLSVQAGGMQTLQLDAGAAASGQLYLVLGSASGIEPGVPVAGLTLPLNPDGYLLHTLQHPGQPPLPGSLGFLSPAGRATAAFALPPGVGAGLAGLSLDHAFGVLHLGSGSALFTSNAAPVSLVP